MDQVLTYFFLIVSVILFSLSIVEWINKDKSLISRILSLLFVLMGYLCLYYWMYRAGVLENMRRLVYSDVAVTYMFGPILYFYVKSLHKQKERFRVIDFLQCVPALTVFIFLLIYNPGGSIESTGNHQDPDYRANSVVFILNTIADMTFFVYTLISAIGVKQIIKQDTLQTEKPMKSLHRMLVISLLTYILFFTGHFSRNDGIISIAVLANGVNCVVYLFTTSRYPEYTQKIKSELRFKNREKEKKLTDKECETAIKRIEKLFQDEKIFIDPDLSVQTLSIILELKNHQLTYIMNQKMGTNFRTYVNNYRIDEAKRLLIKQPKISILDIAISAGYNSKSAFNTTFKKMIGETPSEYRKKMV